MGGDDLMGLVLESADDDPLKALNALAQVRALVERREAVLVRRARNGGATWVQIAQALGVSKQAVHKKHGGRGVLARRT